MFAIDCSSCGGAKNNKHAELDWIIFSGEGRKSHLRRKGRLSHGSFLWYPQAGGIARGHFTKDLARLDTEAATTFFRGKFLDQIIHLKYADIAGDTGDNERVLMMRDSYNARRSRKSFRLRHRHCGSFTSV